MNLWSTIQERLCCCCQTTAGIDLNLGKKGFAVQFPTRDYHGEVSVQEGGSSRCEEVGFALVAAALPQMGKLHVTFGGYLDLSLEAAQRWSAERLKMHPCYC